jgi:hypothetical protein
VAELADALDSKFRNHRFYLIASDQTRFAFFIGKSSVSRVFQSPSRDGQKTAESRTKVEHNPFLISGPSRTRREHANGWSASMALMPKRLRSSYLK